MTYHLDLCYYAIITFYDLHFRNGQLHKEIAALKSHLKSTKRRLKVGVQRSMLLTQHVHLLVHVLYTVKVCCISHIFNHCGGVLATERLWLFRLRSSFRAVEVPRVQDEKSQVLPLIFCWCNRKLHLKDIPHRIHTHTVD